MYPESIQQITGDTPMRLREQLLQRATVALVTPDVVHEWLIRTARSAAQMRFPANLRVAVTGEAHVHEDVAGSGAAFMFRRLGEATIQAGNRYFIQYNAATATIQSPEEHMQGLTGRTVRKVDPDGNGVPYTPLYAPCPLPPGREKPGTRRLPAPDLDHRQRAPGPGIPLPLALGRVPGPSPTWPAGPVFCANNAAGLRTASGRAPSAAALWLPPPGPDRLHILGFHRGYT